MKTFTSRSDSNRASLRLKQVSVFLFTLTARTKIDSGVSAFNAATFQQASVTAVCCKQHNIITKIVGKEIT